MILLLYHHNIQNNWTPSSNCEFHPFFFAEKFISFCMSSQLDGDVEYTNCTFAEGHLLAIVTVMPKDRILVA